MFRRCISSDILSRCYFHVLGCGLVAMHTSYQNDLSAIPTSEVEIGLRSSTGLASSRKNLPSARTYPTRATQPARVIIPSPCAAFAPAAASLSSVLSLAKVFDPLSLFCSSLLPGRCVCWGGVDVLCWGVDMMRFFHNFIFLLIICGTKNRFLRWIWRIASVHRSQAC